MGGGGDPCRPKSDPPPKFSTRADLIAARDGFRCYETIAKLTSLAKGRLERLELTFGSIIAPIAQASRCSGRRRVEEG